MGFGAGRRSHSCSESLSNPPPPPQKKKKSYARQQYLQSLCFHSNNLGIHRLHQPFLLFLLLPPLHKGLPLLPVNHFRPEKPTHPPTVGDIPSLQEKLRHTSSRYIYKKRHTWLHTDSLSNFGSVQRWAQSAIWWNRIRVLLRGD